MAKIKITNLNKINTAIRKRIRKASRDKSLREGIGEIVVEEIQNNPVANAGKATKAWRRYYEEVNKPLDPKYDINKINFTFTGDLMKDLKDNVKADFSNSKTQYVIEHSDKKHRKYKKPKRKRKRRKGSKAPSKSLALTHKQIYNLIRKIKPSYDYLVFTKDTKQRMLKFFTKTIFALIKRGN